MIGRVIKIHSNFYYVNVENMAFECKIREKLKKEKKDVLVGDLVKIEKVDGAELQAAISEILERKNFIPRPSIANIDQIIVVSSINHPHLDFVQLNRFLCLASLHKIPAIICINKFDLEDVDHIKETATKIYGPLGYKIVLTSAKDNYGIDELKALLSGKYSVMAGTSGVGKSSLLNKLIPGIRLRIGDVSAKSDKGTHTTRHVELLKVPSMENTYIADSPGFSYLRFDNILPSTLTKLFPEISELGEYCKYNDCHHVQEDGCNVLENIDKIEPSRYDSYLEFLSESITFKEKLASSGHKNEKTSKTIDANHKGKIKIVKLSADSREKSRKQKNQKLKQLNMTSAISSDDEAYYNIESDLV